MDGAMGNDLEEWVKIKVWEKCMREGFLGVIIE